MKRWIGRWFMVVAVLHTALAVVMFRAQWVELSQAGFFDTVTATPMRGKAVWFTMFGGLLFLFGLVIDALERAGQALPTGVAVGLLVLTVLGVALMPRSGFWLVLPPALVVLAMRPRVASASPPTGRANAKP